MLRSVASAFLHPLAGSMSDLVSNVLATVNAMDPVSGALVMCAVVALSTVSIVVTTTPINLALGAMYGVALGGLLMCLACTLGSAVNFLLGRYICASWAKRKLRESPTLAALEALLGQRGFSIVFLCRLSPVFPMALLGYCVGATSVPFSTYAVATFVGLLPGCLLYAWIGAAASSGADGWGSSLSVAVSVLSTIGISIKAKSLVDEALAGPRPVEEAAIPRTAKPGPGARLRSPNTHNSARR